MEELCGAWKMLNKCTIFVSLAGSEVELACLFLVFSNQ